MSFLSFPRFRFLRRHKDGRTWPDSTIPVAEVFQIHSDPSVLTIEKLPSEIIQYIASFLGPDSAACLTLCSKYLQHVIGRQSWFALQTEDQKKARSSFLFMLQKDLRDWLPCYHCAKLRFCVFKPYSHPSWNSQIEHPCILTDGFLRLLSHFGIRFRDSQMIMKLHHLGAMEDIVARCRVCYKGN